MWGAMRLYTHPGSRMLTLALTVECRQVRAEAFMGKRAEESQRLASSSRAGRRVSPGVTSSLKATACLTYCETPVTALAPVPLLTSYPGAHRGSRSGKEITGREH